MFSKPSKPTNASTRPELTDSAPRKAIAMSLIAENVSVDGDIASDGDIQLDGAVHGDVKVAHLSIGDTGQVEGAITADAVEIRGRVTGTITAKTVRLFATAKVDGDINPRPTGHRGRRPLRRPQRQAGRNAAGTAQPADGGGVERSSLPVPARDD